MGQRLGRFGIGITSDRVEYTVPEQHARRKRPTRRHTQLIPSVASPSARPRDSPASGGSYELSGSTAQAARELGAHADLRRIRSSPP
jgi:hypothetical protein